jgi:hypothetical protein
MFLGWDGGDGRERYEKLTRADRNRIAVGPRVFVGWNQKLIESGAYFYAFSHLPFHQVRLPSDTMTVTCFRDPAARLFSHYRMLREYQRDGVRHPCMQEEEAWLGRSFGDFLQRVPREHALCQLYMFSPSFSVEEGLASVAHVSHVLFTEDFARGIEELNRQTALNLRSIHSRKTSFQEALDPEDEARARQVLEKEYVFLEKLKAARNLPYVGS